MPATHDASSLAVPTISVVLPSCGRIDLLDRCLDALTLQSLDARSTEIIVVDDEPDHHTLHLVTGWRNRTLGRGLRLIYLANTGRRGAAAARNCGWRAAQADIIAFIVDYAVPQPDWLAHGLAALAGGAAVAGGRITTPVPARPTDRQKSAHAHEQVEFTSANCFMRKAVLDRLGGFDERFNLARAADADLHFRLLESGVQLVRAPLALVVHPMRPAPWGSGLLSLRHAVFDALLYKKHPLLYRQRIEARPCWDCYAIVAALLLALACWALGALWPALAAAGVWLALTLRLCARRLSGTAHSVAHVTEMVLTSLLLPPLQVFWRLAGALRFRVRFA